MSNWALTDQGGIETADIFLGKIEDSDICDELIQVVKLTLEVAYVAH